MEIQAEIWKDVKGFDGRYKVSNLGRIQSYTHNSWKLLNPKRPNTQGYYNIALWDSKSGCKGKTVCVHALVADAFCEKPITNQRLEVDHIDCNRLNNTSDNLRWLTSTQHKKVSYEKGEMKRGVEHHHCKLTVSQVLEIRKLYNPFVYSRTMLSGKFGVAQGTVQNILERRTWKHI